MNVSQEEIMKQMTVKQAAALYGCSHANMIVLIHTGRIPATRIGHLWIVLEEHVLALREARDARMYPNAWIAAVQ